MRGVDFHGIETGFAGATRGLTVAFHEIFDLLDGNFLRGLVFKGEAHGRRRNGMPVGTAGAAAAQFHGDLGTIGVHASYKIGKRRNMRVAPQTHGAVGLFFTPAVGVTHNDKAHAALCSYFIKTGKGIAQRTFRPGPARSDGSKNKAVVQLHVADASGGKQFFQCHDVSRNCDLPDVCSALGKQHPLLNGGEHPRVRVMMKCL